LHFPQLRGLATKNVTHQWRMGIMPKFFLQYHTGLGEGPFPVESQKGETTVLYQYEYELYRDINPAGGGARRPPPTHILTHATHPYDLNGSTRTRTQGRESPDYLAIYTVGRETVNMHCCKTAANPPPARTLRRPVQRTPASSRARSGASAGSPANPSTQTARSLRRPRRGRSTGGRPARAAAGAGAGVGVSKGLSH
jgi:hypothetical protein